MRTTLALLLAAPLLVSAAPSYQSRVAAVLAKTPLIDGHNDWAETLVDKAGDARWTMDLTKLDPKQYNTDITRLRAGRVGGQFWSVYVSANLPGPQQVEATLEQIALMKDIFRRYPNVFAQATTAADVRRIHAQGKIASMFGVEGGGQIDGSFAVLRAYRALGASYLTLTHSKTIDWADSATDNPQHGGLTKFGEAVVRELNRLGMLVDLSHVSEDTMIDAIRVSKAPVIFSHSSARGVDDSPRNVSDKVLKLVAANGGVVMVNYAPGYVSEARRRWDADRNAERGRYNAPPYGGLYIGQPDRAKAAMAEWERQHPRPVVTLSQVADHIEWIVKVAGIDHVGLGGDLDGTGGDLPEGLDGVDTYPALLAELMRRGWTDEMIAKLAGGNVLRVMEAAERVAAGMANVPPATATVAMLDGK
ncbi:membrane dipeptidase [Sphingomonas panacisoli]|uniref:Membrane dipeptidase n=1 Tax=Sphingomonas panacisoli TaxID=1813879 RepID=A0A5B8LES9_9SPHN|nr:dipeptidase [Sphingomonas panacisoli]QDZ06667.1 membrane dipeptidase [Sphingomonas panacisoli]